MTNGRGRGFDYAITPTILEYIFFHLYSNPRRSQFMSSATPNVAPRPLSRPNYDIASEMLIPLWNRVSLVMLPTLA